MYGILLIKYSFTVLKLRIRKTFVMVIELMPTKKNTIFFLLQTITYANQKIIKNKIQQV